MMRFRLISQRAGNRTSIGLLPRGLPTASLLRIASRPLLNYRFLSTDSKEDNIDNTKVAEADGLFEKLFGKKSCEAKPEFRR